MFEKNLFKFIILITINWTILYLFQPNYFFAILLLLVLPCIYLFTLLKNKQNIYIFLEFTLILSIPIVLILDYIAIGITDTWFVFTQFSYKFLGVIPYEDFLRGYFMTLIYILFYEVTKEKFLGIKEIYKLKRKRLYSLLLFFPCSVFFIIYFFNKNFFNIPYFYFTIGIFIISIPILLGLYYSYINVEQKKEQKKYKKFSLIVITNIFFIIYGLLWEFIGMHNKYWFFYPEKGDYILEFVIYGHLIPFEELFFYIGILYFAVLTYFFFFTEIEK